MSETMVKTEPAEEDDEENGRTTPVRKSVQEYEQAMIAASPNAMPTPPDGVRHDGSEEDTTMTQGGGPAVAGSTIGQETGEVIENNVSTNKTVQSATNCNTGHGVTTEVVATSITAIPPANEVSTSTKVSEQAAAFSAEGVLVKDEPQDTDLADLEETMARFDEMAETATPPPPPPAIFNIAATPATAALPGQMATPPTNEIATNSTAGVLIKDEPQDTDLAELEKAMASLDEIDGRVVTPPPPPTITNISAVPDQLVECPPTTTSSEQMPCSTNETESTAAVLVKDEPTDSDLAELEKAMASLDEMYARATPPPPPPAISSLSAASGQTTSVRSSSTGAEDSTAGVQVKDEMDERATPPLPISSISPTAPPPPPQIATSPMLRSMIKAINANTSAALNNESIGVLIKQEMQGTDFAEEDHNAATPPKLSAVPLLRLRVKPEFSAIPQETVTEYSSLPKDFFEGILTEQIYARPMVRPKDEPIPENFFDDLLVDKIQERIEEAETQDLEVKYGDRLKQLKELEHLEHSKVRDKKKHKKSKKKSRKRSRSPSPSRRRSSRSPSTTRRRGSRSPPTSRRRGSRSRTPPRRRSRTPPRRRGSRSHTPEQLKHKLMRWPEKSTLEDRMELPTTSKRKRSHKDADIRDDDLRAKLIVKHERGTEENNSPKKTDDRSQKRRTPAADIEIHDEPIHEGMQPHLPEIREECTAKQKRDRIILRAKTLMTYLNVMETQKDKPLSTFLYTSTVRKLPASHSYRNQHIYENRSPLHNINNVSYKFNSHARRFNLEEWGLGSLPPLAANIAKLVGYDAQAVHSKLKVIKIPAKIRRIKREDGQEDDEEDDDEELMQGRSSLFCNAATQTDDMVEIVKLKPKGYDIGVQAAPTSFEIACQTLETESPSIRQYDNSDDLPIMSIMREMNDNQLMALHDFAELLKEPASNAMDMYRLRQRMLDIYKSAQLPSALDNAPAPPSVNKYITNEATPPSSSSSIRGGDGSYFSINDPRANIIGHRVRGTDATARNSNPYDSRISHSRPESRRQQHSDQRNQPPSNGPKYYGRGALRR